jgi:signal peptidase
MERASWARRRPRIVNIDDAVAGRSREHRPVTRQKPAASDAATSPAVHLMRQVAAWVLGLVLLGGTAGALAIALFPVVTSGSAMAVLSGSMSPEYPVGSMVFTRAVDPASVAVGDIITFQRPSNPAELVTHRVAAVDTSTGVPVFTTKGDANPVADLDPVPASAVQGRLWFGVPQLGRITALLHSAQGVGVLVVLICAVVALSPGKRSEEATGTGDAPLGATSDRRRQVTPPRDLPRGPLPRIDPADLEVTTRMIAVEQEVRPTRLPPVPPPAPRRPSGRTAATV